MHNLRHFSQWVHMGFPELLDKIARGLLRVHRPISASLCEDKVAHAIAIVNGNQRNLTRI